MFFFFGKIKALCFLETSILRFALLPYYRRSIFYVGGAPGYTSATECNKAAKLQKQSPGGVL